MLGRAGGRLLFVAAAAAGLLAVMPFVDASPAAPAPKALQLECAMPPDGSTRYVDATQVVIYTCPTHLNDVSYHLGNVRVAVDPRDEDYFTLFSLHGGPTSQGPTDRSRSGLSNVVFPTVNGGLNFGDYPWGPPGQNGWRVFGESTTGTLDSQHRAYVAALWSRIRAGEVDHVIRLYRGADIQRFSISYTQGFEEVEPHAQGAKMADVSLTYVGPDGIPNATSRPQKGHVALTWLEAPPDKPARPDDWEGWINVAWLPESAKRADEWGAISREDAIGPCVEASDAVAWDGRLFVACVVGKGRPSVNTSMPGDIQVWSFDPINLTVSYEGTTGITGTNPRLAVNDDGYFAIAASQLADASTVKAQINFGFYGWHWNEAPIDLGEYLHLEHGYTSPRAARITALVMTHDQPSAFLVYRESGTGARPGHVRPTAWTTSIVSLDQCQWPVGSTLVSAPLQDPAYTSAGPGHTGLDDLQDGLQVYRNRAGEERIKFAAGDYGAIQFGSIVTRSGLADTPCELEPPKPVAPPAPNQPQNPQPQHQPHPQSAPQQVPQAASNPVGEPAQVLSPGQAPAASGSGAPSASLAAGAAGLPIVGAALYAFTQRTRFARPMPVRARIIPRRRQPR